MGALPADAGYCPQALRTLRAWLCWKFEPHDNPGGKPRKVPYYADGSRRRGANGSPDDRALLTTYDDACTAAAKRGMSGVGLALLADNNICALDFDHCEQGLHPDVQELMASTYCEFSPGGTGVHAIFLGQFGNYKEHAPDPYSLEIFSSKGYVTWTGRMHPIAEVAGHMEPQPVTEGVSDILRRRLKRQQTPETDVFSADSGTPPMGLSVADLGTALGTLPPDLPYDQWIMVGAALHHETRGEGFELWESWSQLSPKYTHRDYNYARWASFGRHDGPPVTARSLVRLANEHGAGINPHGPAGPDEFDALPAVDRVVDKARRFVLTGVDDFADLPAPTWIVKGVLPRAELVVLFGQSGVGKSFVALDLVAAVARGLPWRGCKVKPGRVVYVCAEGAGGMRNRLVAYLQTQGEAASGMALEFITDVPNLLEKTDAKELAAAIRRGGPCSIIVVDTLSQCTAGGDENTSEDMGRAVAHCKGLHRATGATVLLIHHSGKDVTKGARGHSSLRAAADAQLEVVKGANGVSMLRTDKQKDGRDDMAWGFRLDVVEIGLDEDGDAITSCVVSPQDLPTAGLLGRALGPNETLVSQALQEFAREQTEGIEVANVLAEVVRRMPGVAEGKRDTRRQHARRALESLCSGDGAPYRVEGNCVSIL